MENVTINITGGIHLHLNLNDMDDFFEDDEFDEDYGDEDCGAEDDYAEDEESDDLKISVVGLPENIDREAVQVVIETACKTLDDLIDKAAVSRKGEPNEGV